MCTSDKQLHLCTCELTPPTKQHKKQKKQDPVFTWRLYRYLGEKWIGMDGMMMMPSSRIGKTLTAAWVLGQINARNCFDFDYQPQNGDNLTIRLGFSYDTGYLSFVYQEKAWIEEFYNPFYDDTQQIAEGKISFLE